MYVDGEVEALSKSGRFVGQHVCVPREGAALLSSLTGTDGLVELGEDITEVQPGQVVSFLPYRLLI